LKVPSTAVAKTIKRYDETVSHEDRHRKDPELPVQQRISSLELTALQIAAQIMLHRVQVTDISQHQLFRGMCESGLHGQIAAKKPLLKDTNKNKRFAWAKKHEQWTLDRWKAVLWSDESKCEMFWFQPLCLCEMQSR
jgi:hypothetical protein